MGMGQDLIDAVEENNMRPVIPLKQTHPMPATAEEDLSHCLNGLRSEVKGVKGEGGGGEGGRDRLASVRRSAG